MEEQGKILIVEDQENWQDTLTTILEDEDYSVQIAANYADALGELRRKPFDLVVIDLRLSPVDEKNRDGMALLGDAFDGGIPAIVVTGYGTAELAREAFKKYGVFSFLGKASFHAEGFRGLVKEAIAAKKARRVRKELTPEQRKEFEELTRRLFRGEPITFE